MVSNEQPRAFTYFIILSSSCSEVGAELKIIAPQDIVYLESKS